MPSNIASNVIVVIDHAEAKVFRTVPARVGASTHEIAPDAPQHFRHNTARERQDGDRDEKHPDDTTFFEQIVGACTAADRIVLIGRGKGQSNEAQHLIAYLAAHHPDVSARVLPAITADLSHISNGELIALGHHALHAAAIG